MSEVAERDIGMEFAIEFAEQLAASDQHDEFCEWALEDWAEDDCQCLGRAGLVELARIQEEAKPKRAPKARAVAKTPSGPKEHTSAKKVRLAAEALGFEVWSVPGEPYIKAATYYASTTDNYSEGDLKTPEKEFARWRLRGRHKSIPKELAFDCSWADGFMGGRIMDPGGKEIFPTVSYHYGAGEIKNYGYTKEYAEKVGQERTARYANGSWTVDRWPVKTFAELTSWIDDLIDLLKVDYKKISTVRKPSVKKTEEGIMHELLNPVVDYSIA